MKLVVVLMIATGGGAISLILTGLTHGREVVLAAGGMIIATTCLVMTYYRYRITQILINKIP